MRKGTIQQEYMTLVNIYTTNIGATEYVKQIPMDIEGERGRNTGTLRDFNTTYTSVDRSSREKINKETAALNYILD